MFVEKKGDVKRGNISWEMFVKLRWTDKKRRGKLTRKILLYPKEMMEWIRIGLNRESKSRRAITQDANI